LEPDVQCIVRPGGGVPDPNAPGRTIGNTFLVGARSTMNFQSP
jgi:porin